MTSEPDIEGRVVLITGAATGVGRALAEGLRDHRATVIAAMRGISDRNAERAASYQAAGIRVLECDVTSDKSVSTAIAKALDEFSRIDVAINNAGIAISGPMEAATVDDLRASFETNVFGPHRIVRAVLPAMRARGDGLIIQMSSSAARWVQPGGGVYSASKWALEAMSEALRWELGELGVDCVLIELGSFQSEIRTSKARSVSDLGRVDHYHHVHRALTADHEARFLGENATAESPTTLVRPVVDLISRASGTRPLRLVLHAQKVAMDRYNDLQMGLTHLVFEQRGYMPLTQNGMSYQSHSPEEPPGGTGLPRWIAECLGQV